VRAKKYRAQDVPEAGKFEHSGGKARIGKSEVEEFECPL
jgi:hypothetical protein